MAQNRAYRSALGYGQTNPSEIPKGERFGFVDIEQSDQETEPIDYGESGIADKVGMRDTDFIVIWLIINDFRVHRIGGEWDHMVHQNMRGFGIMGADGQCGMEMERDCTINGRD